ncbi:MAG TPA: cytochrome b/b6 domain-containing protein [Terracidiphilus sp.]|nr:cytochrome b/b6 domain-containing protein [Terracidiphilus sp.]
MPTASQAKRIVKVFRHPGVVRATHWLTFVAFIGLLISGGEIVIPHPRFYWGEVGNVNTKPLFVVPIPASRDTVPTSYHYVLTDENGWGRELHFEAAWLVVLTGLVYGIYGLASGHFRKRLLPERGDWTWRAYWDRIAQYLRRKRPDRSEETSYNVLQRSSYLGVIFILFPLMIWTGLAMSPSFTAVFPATAALLGGRQSARTIHFFASWLLLFFLIVHVTMVSVSGFWRRMRAMITGYTRSSEED